MGLAMIAAVMVVGSVAISAAELPPGGTFVDDDGSPHEGFIESLAARTYRIGHLHWWHSFRTSK